MSRVQKLTIFLALMLLLSIASLGGVNAATPYQTIPTRTPTPGITPTTPSGGGNPTATNEPPPPAATTAPTATEVAEETATATAVLPFTPPPALPGGQFAAAQPCSMEPTLQATTGRINARSGPGADYEVVGELQYLEVRPIIGRAANAPWWLTALADGTIGWVADSFVAVQGYTGALPLISPPALPSGAAPTLGPAWNPTPNPSCTPPPTVTPTETPTASREATATRPPATSTRPAIATATSAPADEAGSAALASAGGAGPEVTATAVPPPTSALETASDTSVQMPTAAPLEADSQTAGSVPVDWLPVIGAGLIVAGVVVFFVRRR